MSRYNQVELTPRRRGDVETVPMTAVDADGDEDDDHEPKSKMDEWLDYIVHKLLAVLAILIASAVAWYIRLVDVIIEGESPKRPGRLNRCYAKAPYCPVRLSRVTGAGAARCALQTPARTL